MKHGFLAIASWLSLMLVGPVLFIAATIFAFFAVFNESTIKDVLSANNTYGQIVPAVLETAKSNTKTKGNVDIPVGEPWVREVADKAFPTQDLQAKTETLLAGTFAWLEGKTEEPQIVIDFTGNKQLLAQGVGDYATKRAAGLPPCTRFNLPQSIDALTITCLPPGVSPAQIGQELAKQVSSADSGVLSDPVISSKDIKGSEASDNPFGNLEGARNVYQRKSLLTWLLPLIIALLIAAGIALSPDRRAGVKRLGRSLLASGVGLSVLGVVIYIAADVFTSSTQKDIVASKIVMPLASSLGREAAITYGLFALIALLGSLAAFVTLKKLPASR